MNARDILIKPGICDNCGTYIDNNTFFATDIGLVVTHGIGFCSVQCWEVRLDEHRRRFAKKA